MKAFWAIVKKELIAVRRERTILIAIVLQLLIASFSSAIVLGLLSLYDPESIGQNSQATVRLGVVGNTHTALLTYLLERKIQVSTYDSPDAAEQAFRNNTLDAIMYVPVTRGSPDEIKLVLPRADTASSLILMILQEPLKRYENALRQERGVPILYANLPGLPSTSFEFLYAVIVPILLFFPAFVAGSMTIDSISQEIENHTLDTLRAAPISITGILAAKVTAALALAAGQCLLWVGLLKLNRIELDNLGLVLALAIMLAALNALLSALTATLLRDRERSQFLYSLVILGAVSLSYFTDASPIRVLSKLATGDPWTGPADLALYAAAILGAGTLLAWRSRRLATN